MLADEESRAHLDGVLAFYSTLDQSQLKPHPKRIGHYGYNAPGANPAPGFTIVDCGAYVGDTFRDFLLCIAQIRGGLVLDGRIIAIDPLKRNIDYIRTAWAEQIEAGVIRLIHRAVGAE